MKKASVLVVLSCLAACSVETVDENKPITAANSFYGALEAGDIRLALNSFAPEFKARQDQWPRLLAALNQGAGPVTTATLQNALLASNGEDPCYLLTYSVQRSRIASNEQLFLCSKANNSPWLIAGHVVTRLDTHQSISGGVMPTEKPLVGARGGP